jgi:hypothetical protein
MSRRQIVFAFVEFCHCASLVAFLHVAIGGISLVHLLQNQVASAAKAQSLFIKNRKKEPS